MRMRMTRRGGHDPLTMEARGGGRSSRSCRWVEEPPIEMQSN